MSDINSFMPLQFWNLLHCRFRLSCGARVLYRGSLPEVTPEKQPPDWYKLPLPRVAMFEVQD